MDPKTMLKPTVQRSSNGADLLNQSHTEVLPHKYKRKLPVITVPKLKGFECFGAFLVFVFWLALFTGGITVDTRPSRCLISAQGVSALEDETRSEKRPCDQFAVVTKTMVFRASGMMLLWFLPTNLALICASAGVLGTFGNRADLSDDSSPRPAQDNTNPYISAMLRGFFVYLIMISGMLLLDVNPFANPSPAQYIRLAGFLSLFGFVLSYQPRLFRQIIVWTFQQIEHREGQGRIPDEPGYTYHQEKDIHESKTIHANPAAADALNQPPAPARLDSAPEKNGIEVREETTKKLKQ